MNTKQKQHRSASEWQALLSEFEDSQMSATQFCKHHHLSVSSFYQWRNRLNGQPPAKSADKPMPSFIDLGDLSEGSGRWAIVLRLGNGVELSLSQQ